MGYARGGYGLLKGLFFNAGLLKVTLTVKSGLSIMPQASYPYNLVVLMIMLIKN